MPMALALGLIAGLLEFVPFFGPIASGVLAVLVLVDRLYVRQTLEGEPAPTAGSRT